MNKIIVVVGMCGAGKSVACDYLEKQKGYKRVYFGDVTFDRMKKEGLEVNPENERMMREEIRKELGMGAYATLNLPKIKEFAKNNNVVVESLYSWDELKILQEELDLTVVGIITDKNLRYERLSIRDIRPLTKTEAINRDITEIENIFKAGPIAYADYFVFNNGTVEDLEKRIDTILKSI